MTPDVLDVAGGLRVAQRRSASTGAARGSFLRVGDYRTVHLPSSTAVEARTSRGEVWRRLWALPDRFVVEYVDIGAVEVLDEGGVVTFDRELPADMEQHVLLDHVLPLALARRGEVVLHGAVVSVEGRGAVLVGPSGAGKSTLTAYLWQQGWTVGGDDGAVVQLGPPPTAEATYSTVRLSLASADLLGIERTSGTEVVGKRRLEGHGRAAFRQEPVPLSLVAVVQPVPAETPASVTALRGAHAHAQLFSSTFHLDLGGGALLRGVIERLAVLAEAVTVGEVRVPRGIGGLEQVDALLRRSLAGGS